MVEDQPRRGESPELGAHLALELVPHARQEEEAEARGDEIGAELP